MDAVIEPVIEKATELNKEIQENEAKENPVVVQSSKPLVQ